MSKIRNVTVNPIPLTESLGLSPSVLAKRFYTKRLYPWCPKPDIEFDPWCDQEYPKKITYNDIAKAKSHIKHEFAPSPLMKSKHNRHLPMNIYYKVEMFHRTGSFKERGAFYALNKLSAVQQKLGVITASLGNWAMALAYWGQKLNIHVTVVLPVSVPTRTDQACRNLGAEVVIHGNNLNEAKKKAFSIAAKTKLCYINGCDHPHVIAAAGTIGIEVLEQLPQTQAILIPVGGGSLLAGIATAVKHIKPEVLVYGIESYTCPSFSKALQNGSPCQTVIERGLATSLEVPTVGCNSFHTSRDIIRDVVLVHNDWIAKAMLHLIEYEKLVVEGAAAITLGAVMALPKVLRVLQEKEVVCILSGGNLEPILFKCLERVHAVEGRLITINNAHCALVNRSIVTYFPGTELQPHLNSISQSYVFLVRPVVSVFTMKDFLLRVLHQEKPVLHHATFPGEDVNTYQKILNILAILGCNIHQHNVEKSWSLEDYLNDISVSIICETRDYQHSKILKKIIQNSFPNICEVYEEDLCTPDMCKCNSCRNSYKKV